MSESLLRCRLAGIGLGILILALAVAAWSQRAPGKTDASLEYWLVEVEFEGEHSPSRVIQERLNTLGKGGWELVETRDAIGQDGALWLFMQRPAR